MKKTIPALCFSALTLFSVNTMADTIDFDSTSFSGVSSYSESGVTFSAAGLTLETVNTDAYFSTGNVVGTNPFSSTSPFRADFSSTVSSVSVDIGDIGGDADDLWLKVFDSSNNLLASTSQYIDSSVNALLTLSLTASNISYALFGSTGIYMNSVYFDNFTFTPVSEVPVPAAAFLFGPALLGFMGLRRKAKQA